MFMGWASNEASGEATGDMARMAEQPREERGAGHGIVAGTLVATAMGWRPVEALAIGDEVMTFDGGLQRVTGLSRARHWTGPAPCPRAMWPIRVPAGLVGNRRELVLMPEETVVIESDAAEDIYDDPFALIPALALLQMPGVDRLYPKTGNEVVSISFAQDQVIFVEGSALIFCPKGAAGEPIGMAALLAEQSERADAGYRVLPMGDARRLAAWIADDEPACAGQEPAVAETPRAA